MSTYEFTTSGVERLVGQIKAMDGNTGDVPVQGTNGELTQGPGGGGGGGLQVALLDFGPDLGSYDAAALAAGLPIFTPVPGTLIYDVGIVVVTAFDGTTPLLDAGYFTPSTTGLFQSVNGSSIDATEAVASSGDNVGLAYAQSSPSVPTWFQALIYNANTTGGAIIVTIPAPFLVVGSQDGSKGGTQLDSLVGEAIAYVIYALPPAP